jgi:DNA polymerase I-like protein with 3'-5' exonuclease and polymerase domains
VNTGLIVVNTLIGVLEVQQYLQDADIVAYDCETTGLHKGAEVIGFSVCADEDRAFYIVMATWNKEQNKLIYPDEDYKKEVLQIIYTLVGKRLIMHNAIFDCRIAKDFFKVDLMPSVHTDTKVLAHLLNENRKSGLKDLAKEYFGENSTNEQAEMKASVIANGGKLTKSSYEMYKCDSHIMGKYGAQDALLTYRLFLELVPELYAQNLDKFFYEDESMPLLRGPTYQLNTAGLTVDRQALIILKKTLEAECLEAKAFINSEIAAHIDYPQIGNTKHKPFNISSNQNLAWLLFFKLGFEFETLTAEGKNVCKALGLRLPYTAVAKRDFIATCINAVDTIYQPEGFVNGKLIKTKRVKMPWCYTTADKKTLTKLAPKRKWIEKLLEYQRKNKLLNTYVKGIEERLQYGIIHPSFLQHGTTSGRYASRDPNFQNLPRDDKRIKSCVVARPGRTFVGADYSQLEPRVFAYYSGDKRLCEAFNGETDFYSVIGMEVFDKYDCTPQKEGSPEAFGVKYKHLRNLAKVIALASTYGATAAKLAPVTGKSREDTQADINRYFEAFPGVADMMKEAHMLAKTKGYVTNLFGRPRRMTEAMKFDKIYGPVSAQELPYEARNVLNLAVNHRIQSTGASIVNRAAIKLYRNSILAGIDCQLVLQVHDSLIVECLEKDAENVSLLLQDAMENTVKLEGIKLEATPKTGKTLAEV